MWISYQGFKWLRNESEETRKGLVQAFLCGLILALISGSLAAIGSLVIALTGAGAGGQYSYITLPVSIAIIVSVLIFIFFPYYYW